MFLVTQDAADKRVLLLNIPVVHVCVDRHSRSSADQQFRAQDSAHRTYYCSTFSIVNVETYSCYVVKQLHIVFNFLLQA